MKNVAIIPARGGSQRIPKKNIKSFAGRPIIAYSIQAAQKTKLFHRIIVSTDSEEIAKVARDCGAEVPFMRPAALADDYTGTGEVVLHALEWLNESGEKIESLCCLYPTAPFVQPEAIRQGYEALKKYGATSAYSVTTFPSSIFRALKINSQGRIEMTWPEYRDTRSQDLPQTYHDAGQFYWADANKYLIEKRFLSKDSIPIIIPRYLAHDIDNYEDWETAEKLYYAIQGEEGLVEG